MKRSFIASCFAAAAIISLHGVLSAQVLKGADFEDIAPWKGLVSDPEGASPGSRAGIWLNMTTTNDRVTYSGFKGDFSAYDGIELSIHSNAAEPVGEIAFIFLSENEGAEGMDYYLHNQSIDWEGWKVVSIPFDSMTVIGRPLGWDKIDSLRLAATKYRIREQNPNLVVKLDNLKLTGAGTGATGEGFSALSSNANADSAMPGSAAQGGADKGISDGVGVGEKLVFDFEDLSTVSGLELDMNNSRFGKYSGLWKDTIAVDRIESEFFPRDVTDYKGIKVWVYSEKPTGAGLAVVLKSENPSSEGSDYYQYGFSVDWEGWKEIEIPFDRMTAKREPIGFGAINELRIASSGFGIKEISQATVVKFDQLRLYGGPTDQGAGVASGEIQWNYTLKEAIAKSTNEGGFIFVFACTAQVGLCAGDKAFFDDRELKKLLSGFHCFRFDPTENSQYQSFFKIWRVPSLLVYTAKGDELFRMDGELNRQVLLEKLATLSKI